MRTDADRLKHRDRMRKRRAALRAARQRSYGLESTESICDAVGLRLSPPSSLDPCLWARVPAPPGELRSHADRAGNRDFMRKKRAAARQSFME